MLTMLFALCISRQNPTSFADLERAKVNAMGGLVNFGYSAELKNVGIGTNETVVLSSTPTLVSFNSFDSNRSKMGSGSGGGTVSWILTQQDRFAETLGGKTSGVLGADYINPQQLALHFEAGQQVSFSCNPGFTLEGFTDAQEDGLPMRKAVATAPFKRGTVRLTQWFLADKWIVKRFSLEIVGKGESFNCSGRIYSLNL